MPEQPAPVPTDARPTWELVIHDLARVGEARLSVMVAADAMERDAHGRETYGCPLTPGNGRDSLRDAYEEILDFTAYARTAIEELRGGEAASRLQIHYRTGIDLCCAIRGELFIRDGR